MSPDMEHHVNGKSEEAAREEVQAVGNRALPAFSESKQKVVLQPATNCKGHEEDVHVNITGNVCINSGKVVEDALEDPTDTECSSSSSFGDTGSDIETDSSSELSDSDDESPMCDDLCEPLLIRKKKMTDHWKSFIHPIRWRCKWIELQLKKLDSQALKYKKVLGEYDYQKQLQFSKFAADGLDVKSVPRSDSIHSHKVMKRRKRKRVEDCDLSSYMSHHRIFSYYENKDHTDGACLEDFLGVAITGGNADNIAEFWLNDVWSSLDHEGFDKSVDDIIQKIEAVQSHVQKLKTRIDNVVSENPRKFCSVTQLSMVGPNDGFNKSVHNPASFADVLMSGNTLSTREGITPFVETTNGRQLDVLLENTKGEALMQNQAAKEELHDFENVGNQLEEIIELPVEKQKSISLAQVSEPDLVTENVVHNADSTLNACSTLKSNSPRNTRRGRQKSGSKSSSRR